MLHLELTQEQAYKLGWGIPDKVVIKGNVVSFEGNEEHKGACICARCNNMIEGTIYYIPVLNDTLCKNCFKDSNLPIAEEDKEYELNNYNRVKSELLLSFVFIRYVSSETSVTSFKNNKLLSLIKLMLIFSNFFLLKQNTIFVNKHFRLW